MALYPVATACYPPLMPVLPLSFAELDAELTGYDAAETVILPIPFERTTSYGRGAAMGPTALLKASQFVELYDDELECEPCDQGIHTLAPCVPTAVDLGDAIHEIEKAATEHLEKGKFLVGLGGEHSLSHGLVRAAALAEANIGVVQFDAHADLRNRYENTPHSHACVMRRILELGLPTLAIGIRSLSRNEANLIHERQLSILWGQDLARDDVGCEERFVELLENLPETVYLTFDLDFFDPSLVPATGTPEPGGGLWFPTLRLLRELFERKRVLAMDVVELAPIPGQPASDFLAAKLVYKCLGYRQVASM